MSVIAEHQNLTAGYSDRRTASAVIYDDDGVWGSVVFHQSTNDAPVIIGLLFQNINVRPVYIFLSLSLSFLS